MSMTFDTHRYGVLRAKPKGLTQERRLVAAAQGLSEAAAAFSALVNEIVVNQAPLDREKLVALLGDALVQTALGAEAVGDWTTITHWASRGKEL